MIRSSLDVKVFEALYYLVEIDESKKLLSTSKENMILIEALMFSVFDFLSHSSNFNEIIMKDFEFCASRTNILILSLSTPRKPPIP